ncbi:hypothetical protein DTO166G4_6748 [Paecilomyces variotii]|nr:hypothetical protein DTO166G4_6748 [Paecilomyces variotii]KAJ9238646.1 hypothetical protein DTO166G5_2767 [Paecilomyces variotii]
MSSNLGQNLGPSKAINIPSPSASATFHSSHPQVDSGSQRRPGGSGSFGAGSTSRNTPSPRNNQSRKTQHKRQRRPRLVDEDAYAESTIMRSTTSRKGQTSITHLMNFALPPRPQYQPQPHRNNRRYPAWGLGSGYHAVDKARYVHANYRFIVNPTRDYHAQASNADVHLDWDSVLQVLVSSQTQAASCPICLEIPVAPRMAKCGHIFCLPCLIRYMHSSDDESSQSAKKQRWKKCPICYDTIYISDTRPVRWFSGQEGDLPVENGDVVMRLIKREPGSTLALPRDGGESLASVDDIPWYHVAEVADYARIMKGGEDYMMAQYDTEIEQLRIQGQEDNLLFGDDTTWTRKAIGNIYEAKEKIKGIGNPPDMSRVPVEKRPQKEPINFEPPPDGVPDMYTYEHATKSGQTSSAESVVVADTASTSPTSVETDRLSSAMSNLKVDPASEARSQGNASHSAVTPSASQHAKDTNRPHPPDQPFYFYQALPHYYLSPLDIRILKAAFGDFSLFPATILPRVEHISTGHVVDDELRKRAKYLGHLPYGCEVNFLECDWRDLVSPEILDRFRGETEKRRKRNREKEVREEKERIRAEKEEEKNWAIARRKGSSAGVGPSDQPISDRDFLPLSSAVGDPSLGDLGPLSASPPYTSNMESRFSALASPSTSPSGPRTVWGTAAVSSTSPPDAAPRGPAHDGWLQGWEDHLLEEQQELWAQAAAGGGSASASSGNRKKKNKKITLMSTNIQRGA